MAQATIFIVKPFEALSFLVVDFFPNAENIIVEDDNAEYIFIGGYIQCLEDILHAKRKEV